MYSDKIMQEGWATGSGFDWTARATDMKPADDKGCKPPPPDGWATGTGFNWIHNAGDIVADQANKKVYAHLHSLARAQF
ncbi:hypothetical protein FRC12_004585 [Ceratobasidium sp. 428]|nr:hypothetical protein FRC12_004585 [Ceratobasidium sp. 428]